MPAVELQVYPGRQMLAEILSLHAPNLCFLDAGSDLERAVSVVGEMLALHPGLQIVVLLPSNDSSCILRCLRAGAAEFLIRPFTEEQLNPVLERLLNLHPGAGADSRRGRVITVIPAKGGCGGTTIACNFAHQCRRLGAEKVLLADLDPMTGTVSFLLKLKSNYSFADALNRAGALDADLWKGMVTNCLGVDVLLSPENPVDGMHDLHDPRGVIDFARQAYDTIVVDCAGPFGDWNLSLARCSDEVLLVTTNELPALQATHRALIYLENSGIERSKVSILVNRYNRDVGLSHEAISTALRGCNFHVIPSDYEAIQKALMEGKPMPPSSSFSKSLAAVVGQPAAEQPAPATKKSSSWSSLFSLFSRVST